MSFSDWVPCLTNDTPGTLANLLLQQRGLKGQLFLLFQNSYKVAHKLCNVVTDQILKHESRVRARSAKDQANFEHAVGLIMGDLLAAAVRDEAGWAYRSVSKKSFTDSNIKGNTFNTIMDSLGALGYYRYA